MQLGHDVGPFEWLQGIGELVDSAGCGDSNAARNALAERDHEKTTDAVWIVVHGGLGSGLMRVPTA